MKKVLFITHYEGIGGANLSMLYLIENLRKYEDIDPCVILPGYGPIADELQKHGISYKVLKYLSWRANGNVGFFKLIIRCVAMYIFNTIAAYKISRTIKDIDVIYANSSKVVLPVFLRWFNHKPIIWHLREFGSIDYPMTFLVPKPVVNRWLKSADAIIAISNEIMSYYKNNYCSEGKYHLVYNGIEENDYKLSSFHKENEVLKICIVGGVDPSKNQEDLLHAVNILYKKNIKITVDIFGQDNTEYGTMLKGYVRNNNLESIVSFKGQTKGINSILPKYDVGVITSKYEAFGRVVVEYMMANLVVVASNAGACPELVHNDDTGFLYNLGDSDALADILETLYFDRKLCSNIAAAGNDYALTHFTARINAHNIKNVIDSI